MSRADALRLAIDLMHSPSQARLLRSDPLPDDVLSLVRVATGDEEATKAAADATGRSREVLRDAAAFFVEQVLLYPDADSYRVLGVMPDATYHELRRNMAMLLRWLHPDRDGQGERAVFTSRVTQAWDNLKNKERRAAYDRLRRNAEVDDVGVRRGAGARSNRRKSNGRSAKGRRHGQPGLGRDRHQSSAHFYPLEREGLLRRILTALFGKSVF
jgi:hypothetical protein